MPEAEFDGDVSEVDEIWLGGATSMPGEEFVEALNMVVEMQESLREFREEMDDMDIGLDRGDAIDLLWGRTALTKTQIQATFDVMDAIISEDPQDIAPRLMADKTSELTIAEAAEVWEDMVDLAEKYGSLNDDTDEAQQ